jgi:hypothetical protein
MGRAFYAVIQRTKGSRHKRKSGVVDGQFSGTQSCVSREIGNDAVANVRDMPVDRVGHGYELTRAALSN